MRCSVAADAYTSQSGAVSGVPVALLGLLFFVFVIGLVALCSRSKTAAVNLPGYLFAASTLGLAAVMYFAYASYVHSGDGVPAVRGLVRRRHRAVPHLRSGGKGTHVESSRSGRS